MSQSRSTCSSSKKASGISDSFINIAHDSIGQEGSSNPIPQSPTACSVEHSTGQPTEDDGNQGENFPPPDNEQPDPDDEPDPDETGSQPDNPLARSLELLANRIAAFPAAPKPKSKIQTRVPDIFDGTDPTKIDNFIFQCSMYITARSADFPDDESCVAFVLSYLKGVPLNWFQGEMTNSISDNGNLPAWFLTFPMFLKELWRLFGPRDPVADATNVLESLKYKNSTKAARYTIEFNRHSRHTGWNETALSHQYYKGLPDRLKDEISHIGKPAGLRSLQDLVATLDQRYWERQSEISQDK